MAVVLERFLFFLFLSTSDRRIMSLLLLDPERKELTAMNATDLLRSEYKNLRASVSDIIDSHWEFESHVRRVMGVEAVPAKDLLPSIYVEGARKVVALLSPRIPTGRFYLSFSNTWDAATKTYSKRGYCVCGPSSFDHDGHYSCHETKESAEAYCLKLNLRDQLFQGERAAKAAKEKARQDEAVRAIMNS